MLITDPASAKTEAKASEKAAVAQWFVRADDDEFGPVDKTELDEWAVEGRLDAQCDVRCETWKKDEWKSAAEVYPSLAVKEPPKPNGADAAADSADDDNELKLAPVSTDSDADESAGDPSADSDNPFAALESGEVQAISPADFGGLAGLDSGSQSMKVLVAEDDADTDLDDDDIAVTQGSLDDALGVATPEPSVRLAPATSGPSNAALESIADTADEMQGSIQAVAFLSMAGCGLSAIVGVFWIARSAPEGLWAFTVAGLSLLIGAAVVGLAAKNLLTYFKRVDAFAENGGSKELARQMTAAKKFWFTAMIAAIVVLALSVVSLLAFMFVPVEHKGNKPTKDDREARVTIFSDSSRV